MPEPPPPKLIALMEHLGLASPAQVGRMGGRVRRLARDLPRFESVWVDALAQARILTPFQAAEINAGRGESLRIGPYVLCERLRWPYYVACYRARHIESGGTVQLAVPGQLAVTGNMRQSTAEALAQLEKLATVAEQIQSERQLGLITDVGADDARIWAAAGWIEGQTAAERMVSAGRFSPEVVLEIARTMLADLVALEKAGLCHGDVSASGLLLKDSGQIVLPLAGLRAIVRPEEGYAQADMLPEAYDYLAPERVTEGTAPNTAGDVYACGCVWWQLLCGRRPLSGGNSLAKLRAAQEGKVPDVRQLAPETPGSLAAAISACLQRDPHRRPESMARLAATLGSSTRVGKLALTRCLARRHRRSVIRKRPSHRLTRRSSRSPLWLTGAFASVAVCLAVAVIWPIWSRAGATADSSGSAEDTIEQADRDTRRINLDRPLTKAAEKRPSEMARNAVLPAHYFEPTAPRTPPDGPQDFVLPCDGPVDVESLELRPGQRVRGNSGERPVLMVPRTGLLVEAENVRFEKVEFVWDHQGDSRAALIDLRASRVEFRGCLFRSIAEPPTASPPAVRWTHPDDANEAVLSLPNGRLRLADCVMRGVSTGIDCRTVGALAVELVNTLHLGNGPLIRLDHWPGQDEPVQIVLTRVTLRGSGPLLAFDCRGGGSGRGETSIGEISIRALRCAFAPGLGTALMRIVADASPEQLLRGIRWSGEGSLVSPHTAIAAWRLADGSQQTLDDTSISIDGLVRSEVGFAGEAGSDPASSRAIRWQAPLRTPDPPGIDPAGLSPARASAPSKLP